MKAIAAQCVIQDASLKNVFRRQVSSATKNPAVLILRSWPAKYV